MKGFAIFLYEWKHFLRNPFKLVAVVLFAIAGIWALHNGASLHDEQRAELERIQAKSDEMVQEAIGFFDAGLTGPEGRPWVNITEPFWASYYNSVYCLKSPSPAMVYSIGQAEQYGFYKDVSFWSSPYDSDLAAEIANPERLQSGTLDFSFVILYLLPLLFLVCLHNIKGAESDRGILPLIQIQVSSQAPWLLSRVLFYASVIFVLIVALLAYGAILTGVFAEASSAFLGGTGLCLAYLLLWTGLFTLILLRGKSTIANTLSMVGVWILFAFVVPATVQQIVGISTPASMMTELIDAQREDQEEIWDLPDPEFIAQLVEIIPEIKETQAYTSGNGQEDAIGNSASALANHIMKQTVLEIEAANQDRNRLIRYSHWINPVTFFQNQFNLLSGTHYQDYEDYRAEIQAAIDLKIRLMVVDSWNGVVVDKDRFMEYREQEAKPVL